MMPSDVLTEGQPRTLRLFCQKISVSDSGCWIWTASTRRGYGRFSYRDESGRSISMGAHRFAYLAAFGTLPDELDHIVCDTPLCVNPFHLCATTSRDNVLRSNNPCAINKRRTVCKRGHELVMRPNGWRRCKICQLAASRLADRRRYDRKYPRKTARKGYGRTKPVNISIEEELIQSGEESISR